jgi:hypothetical protein
LVRRATLPAAALAGALVLCSPASAQNAAGDIAERIESTFELVLGNSEELAIPLTRRALARRASEDGSADSVEPLAYGLVENASDMVAAPEETGAITAAETVEDASADDPAIARLPRPRPWQEAEADANPAAEELATADPAAEEPAMAVPAAEDVATAETTTADIATDDPATEASPATDVVAEEAMGGPLDLVATAPESEVSQEFAASALAHEAIADPPPAPPAAPVEVAAAAPETPAEPPLELIASGSCLSPADATDKDDDFKRNAEILSANTFCIAEETFKERRRHWTIATIRTSRPGPLFAVMHDDEDMSFDSAVAALKAHGGTLVAVETGGKRNQDGIDPNRNFSADGVGCKKLGKDATPKFTAFFQKLFDAEQPIIALHNNTGKRIPTGGVGHVSMDDLPKDMEKQPSDDPGAPLAGDRTLVLMTSPVPVTTVAESTADELNAKGINAVIEPVTEGKGDCSLSNYALLTGHSKYFNVTVDKDEGDKQQKIIDAILAPPLQTAATQ